MIGLVMGDDELVERALYGLEDDGLATDARDNDGGFIKVAGQKAGFLANLEEPFSPDGYYTEGPYYQRYAMYPFLVFAQGLNNVKPELKVLEYKNGVLLKAVGALLRLSDADGEFFPLNDAQKGMSYLGREVITAVDIAYHVGGQDAQLLSIAQEQGEVLLDDAGFSVAAAIRDGKAKKFDKTSVNLSDGPDGRQGGVAILRSGDEDLTLVFKYAAQGLSHGHYDKLSYSLYERGDEVLQDYGLARFVNIEQKGGGNYLPENTTWAKQTIAHNTLTQNQTSHFRGEYEIGSQHHSELHFYDDSRSEVQVVSATDTNAYPATGLLRTVALIKADNFEKPLLLDIFKVTSESRNQYDLPFYFMGQVISANFDSQASSELRPLGKDYGYQHLYLEGKGRATADNTKFSWLGNGRFRTLTSVAEASDELMFTRIGANDPAFNLRRDAGFMIRRNDAGSTVFASTVELHGSYSPVSENAVNSHSNIATLAIVYDDENYTAVTIEDLGGYTSIFAVSNQDGSASSVHRIELLGQVYEWTGPYLFSTR